MRYLTCVSLAPPPCRLLTSAFRPSRKVHQRTPPAIELKDKDTSAEDEQPRELPAELWSACLQSIFLQGNQIKWLPDYLGKFSGLQRLDISG